MHFSTFSPVLLLTALTAASPLNITARNPVLPPADNRFQLSCSTCNNFKGELRYLYATGMCETLENGEQFYACVKPYHCGICMVFKDEQCMGDLVNFGDQGWDASLRGSKSYWCIDS